MPTRNIFTPIKDVNGNNTTQTHLSTNIIIKVDGMPIGAVKTLNITESRQIAMIAEVGADGFIDSAPSRSTEISGSCTRTRFAGQRITEAFGRGYIHIHSQRVPFDIEIQDIYASADTANSIITTVENVWFENLDFSYQADNYIIEETIRWKAERIYSILNNNNVVSSVANGNGFPIYLNRFEQEADRGAFTGALDAPGLLNAYLNDPTN